MKQSETITKISAALVKAQRNMGTAVKDSKNPFFKSNYADINAINDVLLPALHAEGIVALQPPTTENGKNYIETVLLHESGEFLGSLNEVIVAKQNDPQSYLAAQTYTRRGALQAFLNIGSEDDDGNSAAGKTSVRSQVSAPVTKGISSTEPAGGKIEYPVTTATKTVIGKVELEQPPATTGSKSFRKPKTEVITPPAAEEL